MKQLLKSLRHESKGAVAIEYALLVGLIAMVLIVVFNELSFRNQNILNTVSDSISEQTPS